MDRDKDILDFQKEVGKWAVRTFKGQTVRSCAIHLEKEVKELKKALEGRDTTKIGMELADCYLLLLDIAYRLDIPLQRAAEIKHQINQDRKWQEPDESGVYEHVREEEERETDFFYKACGHRFLIIHTCPECRTHAEYRRCPRCGRITLDGDYADEAGFGSIWCKNPRCDYKKIL